MAMYLDQIMGVWENFQSDIKFWNVSKILTYQHICDVVGAISLFSLETVTKDFVLASDENPSIQNNMYVPYMYLNGVVNLTISVNLNEILWC